jgi:protein kinase A
VKHLLRRDLSKRFGNLVGGIKDIKSHRLFASIRWDHLLGKSLKVPYVPKITDPSAKESDFLKKRSEVTEAIKSEDDPFKDW